jgi:steroid delta-isomerase-like uncharacterized protein
MSQENKAVVERCIQGLFSEGRLEAADEYLADDFVNHDPVPGFPPDRDGMKQTAALFRAAFPDWHSTLHELLAEGDKVVERFTAGGTHEGEFLGIPATGRRVEMDGINIFRLENGRIVERWGVLDRAGMLQRLRGEL